MPTFTNPEGSSESIFIITITSYILKSTWGFELEYKQHASHVYPLPSLIVREFEREETERQRREGGCGRKLGIQEKGKDNLSYCSLI